MRAGWLAAVLLVACGGEETIAEPPPTAGCPPATLTGADGSCLPAGSADADCASGFERQGPACTPVLPPERCSGATMAVPGDASCRPIMPCDGSALPVDDSTQHVDASYAGTDSDGSADRPWRSIGEAYAAALPGALVVVAAGSYAEDLVLAGKPLRLWGVCPEQVEIVGSGSNLHAVTVLAGADGSAIGGMRITGGSGGIGISGSSGVVVDRVWIDQVLGWGIDVVDEVGPAEVSILGSVVEATGDIGIRVARASATIGGSALRNTPGRSISLHDAMVTIDSSLIEDGHDVGLRLAGAHAVVTSTVVRAIQPGPDGLTGRGIGAGTIGDTTQSSLLQLDSVLVQDTHDVGVFLYGSRLEARHLVIERSLPEPGSATGGYGLSLQADDVMAIPSTGQLDGVVIRTSHEVGLRVAGSEAQVDRLWVDDTRPREDIQRFGQGVMIESDPVTGLPSSASLRGSLVQRSHEVGIFTFDATATLEAVHVQGTSPGPDGFGGDGLVALSDDLPSSVWLWRSRIEQSARAAVGNFGSGVSIGDSLMTCQAFDLDGETHLGKEAVFEDRGGNLCGCPEADAVCKRVSTGLEPPTPLD